jgi:DNA-binding NtrC family response regulator
MPTILLVDDDAAVSQMLEEHLVQTGFDVIVAGGTTQAQREIESKRRVDLLLVDLVMPADEPDGLAFANQAKAQAPDVPIIFMTGYYGFVAKAGAMPATVLYKPIDLNVLTREINARLAA